MIDLVRQNSTCLRQQTILAAAARSLPNQPPQSCHRSGGGAVFPEGQAPRPSGSYLSTFGLGAPAQQPSDQICQLLFQFLDIDIAELGEAGRAAPLIRLGIPAAVV